MQPEMAKPIGNGTFHIHHVTAIADDNQIGFELNQYALVHSFNAKNIQFSLIAVALTIERERERAHAIRTQS